MELGPKKTPQKADFAMKQTNICRLSGDITIWCSVCALFIQDVHALIASLHCVVASHEIPNWQHLDFIWGLDAAVLLYPKVASILHHAAAL